MPDVQVAVPSHARADVVADKTLRLLADRGVPRGTVRVFVAPDEVDHYRATVDPGLLAEVVPGALGLAANHNAVTAWYPEGTELVSMDDDVADVRERLTDKEHGPVADLGALFAEGFARCRMAAGGLWGVYPVLNPMFMKDRVSVGLHFLIGQLWGCVNTHAEHGQVHLQQKDDYERTLRWWRHQGFVIRFDGVACKSRMHSPGGLQADGQPDRQATNRRDVQWLLAEFPDQVAVTKRRSKLGLEVRLVQPKAQRVLGA